MELDSLSMVTDSLATIAQNLPQREIAMTLAGNDLLNFENNFENLKMGGIILGIMAAFGALFVPFIAIVSIVWFILKHKRAESKLRADLMAKAMEHGQTIPENLFETKKKKNPLNKAIMWIAVGLGFQLFFIFSGISLHISSAGLAESGFLEKDFHNIYSGVGISMIPLFVGLGYLLIHFFDKKQAKENDSDK